MQDPYRVLGVSPQATDEEIKKAEEEAKKKAEEEAKKQQVIDLVKVFDHYGIVTEFITTTK